MSAQEDGTGQPNLIQKLRIWLADRILGKTLWRWMRKRIH